MKRGDGLVFDAAAWRSPDAPQEGGSVYDVRPLQHDVVLLQFGHGAIDFARLRVGDLVWRSFDPALARQVKRFTEATSPVSTRPVSFTVTARRGTPLLLTASTVDGLSTALTGTTLLTPARQRATEGSLFVHTGL